MAVGRRTFLRLMGAGAGAVLAGRFTRPEARTNLVSDSGLPAKKKVLIAHRGASSYAPENTLEAFRLGVKQGADYIEHDLHITRDGELICLHDLTLERTTNVKEVFPYRYREEKVNGATVRRWYASDFTVSELKRLDAGSWFDPKFKGIKIPTWQETIEALRGKNGLYIELKYPERYAKLGFDMERMILDQLKRNRLDQPGADPKTPILIQTFNPDSLKKFAYELKTKLPLQLLLNEDMRAHWLSPAGLKEAKEFLIGLGPAKHLLDESIVKQAQALGLTVSPYTFRSANTGQFRNVREEMAHYLYKLGVDGAITDDPDQFPATPGQA